MRGLLHIPLPAGLTRAGTDAAPKGAWDLITSITVSNPYGYMKHGCDFDDTLADLDKTID